MTLVSQAEIVVVDTSVVVNFAKAGALKPLGDYLGGRAVVTQDVFGELTDWAKTHAAIGRLLERRPWSEPIELTPEQSLKVVETLGFVDGADPKAQLQDVGEVSCVVLAQDLRDSNRGQPVLLLDDIRYGKKLAKVRGLEIVDTPGLIVEMVYAAAISKQFGYKVWRATFTDRSKWSEYEARVTPQK
jgi:predicted nucleic acid-binding protein